MFLDARHTRAFDAAARAGRSAARKRARALWLVVLAAACVVGVPGSAAAQARAPSGSSKSGYATTPTLEGPEGVTTQLEQDDVTVGGLLSPDGTLRVFEPWYNFKRGLNQKYGLQLSFSLQALYQSADETLTGVSDAAATRTQIQGAWTLLNRGGKNTGRLTFRLRNQQAWNDNIPPTQLAPQFGSIVNAGTGFSDAGYNLAELAWRQSFADGEFRVIGGVISASAWYNSSALSSSLMGFQNSGMQASLSKAEPGRGLGLGLGTLLGPKFAMVAGVHDANGTATESPLDTIEQGEYFYTAELRYLPSGIENQLWDSVKVQLWYQDPLEEKGLSAGSGVAWQAGYLFDDRWYPFAFGGWSDGDASIFKQDFVAGLGVKLDTRRRPSNDMFGVAAGWGDPSVDALQQQYTAEMFYRLQLLSSFAITPSVQLVRNPAANPEDDQVVLWGLRTRIQF